MRERENKTWDASRGVCEREGTLRADLGLEEIVADDDGEDGDGGGDAGKRVHVDSNLREDIGARRIVDHRQQIRVTGHTVRHGS